MCFSTSELLILVPASVSPSSTIALTSSSASSPTEPVSPGEGIIADIRITENPISVGNIPTAVIGWLVNQDETTNLNESQS